MPTTRSVLLNLCTGISMCLAGCLPVSAATRQVVLLFDERTELPGLTKFMQEFSDGIQSGSSEPVEVYRETMDLSRFGSNSYNSLLRDFLRAKYADKKIDVAVAVMAPAFEFLAANADAVFPDAHIVFSGLDRTQFGSGGLSPGGYGVLAKREFAPTLDLALRLHPRTENVVVVSGTSEFDASLLAQAKQAFRPYEDRLSFSYLSGLSFERVLEKVSGLGGRDVVLFVSFFRDGSGLPFVPHEAVERISGAAGAPVYAFVDQFVGRGIVGGSVYNTAYGAQTAELVSQLLQGKLPAAQVSEASGTKVAVDWRQLQRWSIDEDRLPPGSEIHFRQVPIWQRYRGQVVGVVALLFLQSVLIGILLYEDRRRRIAEAEAKQRMSELAHVNRVATAGELSASIAHELSQPLMAIRANAEALQMMLQGDSPDVGEIRAVAADIKRDDVRASEVINHLRRLLHKAPLELQPMELNAVVRDAIDLLLGQLNKQRIGIVTALEPSPLHVRGDAIQLQQVVINLMVNAMDAMAHAPASLVPAPPPRIEISTERSFEFVEVSIADNGPGIPPDRIKDVFQPFFTTKSTGMGMGLSIARTIIEAHKGAIYAENRAGGGAVFRIRLPLDDHGQPA